jgi:putative transposase
VVCQCRLLGVGRSGLYYQPKAIAEENLALIKLIDRRYPAALFYEARKMAAWLQNRDTRVNRKRVQRLMRLMGLRAVYRRPRSTIPTPTHRRIPYLLEGLSISAPNQVRASGITFIPMARVFLCLVAVMDWYSRNVLARRPSNTMDAGFRIDALSEALGTRKPEFFNSDQGSQFTGDESTGMLERHGISMDGKGSYNDNLFIERLWRTVKYEELYLKACQDGWDQSYYLKWSLHHANCTVLAASFVSRYR